MKRGLVIGMIVGLVGILSHIHAQWGPPNDPTLLEAIETVKNFLGDPNVTPLFEDEKESREEEMIGPGKFFVFRAPGYTKITVQVDTVPMQIVSWLKDDNWLLSLDRAKPLLSIEQMLQIATHYAQTHWPHWNEFPQKMILYRQHNFWTTDPNTGEQIITKCLAVSFRPYFVNSSGTKIPFLPRVCSMVVEPYEGAIVYFFWSNGPKMTLTSDQLNPTIPPSQAEVEGEKALFNYYNQMFISKGFGSIEGAVTIDIVMDPNRDVCGSDDTWWPERLCIGATKTGDLRLMYVFDEVLIRDAVTGEEIQHRFVCMDAHTKEVLVDMGLSGFSELSPQAKKRLILNTAIGIGIRLSFIAGFILLSTLLVILILSRKRSGKLLS